MSTHRIRLGLFLSWALVSRLPGAAAAPEPGLLFYVSGEHGTTADFSAGATPKPNFESGITSIPDGAKGAALRCSDLERLSWWAPGNIYAQRGTLSFFWRPHTAVGPTEFPVFRVGYADHSSWDMVFLRIDYNGHGFDAFVTDASLARTRVSVTLDPFPPPDQWIHLALAWDETRGIRFYVNGRLAASKETTAMLQRRPGPIRPAHRASSALGTCRAIITSSAAAISTKCASTIACWPTTMSRPSPAARRRRAIPPAPARDSDRCRAGASEWAFRVRLEPPGRIRRPTSKERRSASARSRFTMPTTSSAGTGRPTTASAKPPGRASTIAPGLPGRNDYFQLPDWDCYSLSGKSITFTCRTSLGTTSEISGAGLGNDEPARRREAPRRRSRIAALRAPRGQEQTVPRWPGRSRAEDPFRQRHAGGADRRTVRLQVEPGREPAGSFKLAIGWRRDRSEQSRLEGIGDVHRGPLGSG